MAYVYYSEGLRQRVINYCGGNVTLADNWWNTPHPAFNLETPAALMESGRGEIVAAHIIKNFDYTGSKFDHGPKEKFYNDATKEWQNYHHTDNSIIDFLASQKSNYVK